MTITILSLNTAVDRTLVVPDLQSGGVYRTGDVCVTAGGKGLNVARVLRTLGEPVRVIGFLGGFSEALVRQRCAQMGIDQHWVPTSGDSRTCLIIVDGTGGPPTVINERGPAVGETQVEDLRSAVERLVGAGDILSISGSVPPGIPPGFLGEIVSRTQSRGARVLVDTSEERLVEALSASPWAICPTVSEAAGALGARSPEALAAALGVRSKHVLLTMGRDGAMYGTAGALWQVVPPPITALNPIASGDALVAGFLSRIERGESGLDSARFGVACGTCNAAQVFPGIPSAAAVEEMASRVEIRRVHAAGRS